MSLSERSQELIQKYLEALASEAEIAELEGLLATDPEFAAAFAAAARLEAGLHSYFRQQYKIDQVAALLNAPESPGRASGREREAARSWPAILLNRACRPVRRSLPDSIAWPKRDG